MNKLDIDCEQTYIIGVSGGPDSMALFDMCVKQGISVIAAHMNYCLRESAKRDMQIVQDYCESHGITCRIRMQNKECSGNFQAFAREMRYAFYKELCEEYHAHGVLLAHQLDDHLETYLMLQQQHRYAGYLGIQQETTIMGCRIFRPLLHKTKRELEAYCKTFDVVYGIDESNLSDHYARNRIRHNIIDHMNDEEKEKLCLKIQKENEAWAMLCECANNFLKDWNYEIKELKVLEEALCRQVLIHFILHECGAYLTHKEIDQIMELTLQHANGWTRNINKRYVIYSEYGKLCMDTLEDVSYTYTYKQLRHVKTPYFEIKEKGSRIEGVTLQKEDFPIMIRSVQKEDEIRLRFGTKKINRWFIDRKIPKKERRRWPVVISAQGNVIMVVKIGCDITHFSNNPTCFVLK